MSDENSGETEKVRRFAAFRPFEMQRERDDQVFQQVGLPVHLCKSVRSDGNSGGGQGGIPLT